TSTDEVVVPSAVETVENYALNNVINVIYNGSLSTDKWGAICKNGYIEDLYVYENTNKKKIISSTFLNDKDTTNINLAIPEGVEEIGENAFYNAYNTNIHFVSLSLPSTLKIIGNLAFYNTGIESNIIIPDGVTSIGRASFAYHNSHYIYIPASVTTIDSCAFQKPYLSSGGNGGDVVFEDHSKWKLYRYSAYSGGETLYREGDYFNDTQTVYNDLVHYRYEYTWYR
ncbi:MAG: leucine-rich repeat domain-containing protein, partial [Bacilli bacterium]|nr:leucine-rich repeat domain-containing protein [Bacilli bacterium]